MHLIPTFSHFLNLYLICIIIIIIPINNDDIVLFVSFASTFIALSFKLCFYIQSFVWGKHVITIFCVFFLKFYPEKNANDLFLCLVIFIATTFFSLLTTEEAYLAGTYWSDFNSWLSCKTEWPQSYKLLDEVAWLLNLVGQYLAKS